MPNNKITFGLRNVHYALANQDANGNWSFDTPVALPGAQEFSSEVVGGSTNVYADDTLYASLVQNAGRTLTLKFTEIPDNFKTAILGYRVLRTFSEGVRTDFAGGVNKRGIRRAGKA